ncbi:MAG TPA: DEAD/DEAH box helicase [Anaeromyxobacter sp.]|nr:DEAD/DEAH box helicase [Anaeromyxobacter sp.]
MTPFTLALAPTGHLALVPGEPADALPDAPARRIRRAFERGAGEGLLHLGAAEVRTPLPPVLAFFRDLGRAFVTALCATPDLEARRSSAEPAPPPGELEKLAAAAPPMTGGEYLGAAVLFALWNEILAAWRRAIDETDQTVDAWLSARDPGWGGVGRVHLHLAENPREPERPFAFLATYTVGLAPSGKPLHRPLGEAVRAASGAKDRERLLALLRPVHRASEQSALVKALADSGALFRAQAWTPVEAHRFLHEVPALEDAGVIVRVPAWWSGQRPPRPRITITVGDERPAGLGLDAVLDFDARLTLGDEELTEAELRALLEADAPLVLFKGRWVEVDRERLRELMRRWLVARQGAAEGVSFLEAMRLLAGAPGLDGAEPPEVAAGVDPEWVGVEPGAWLEAALAELRGGAGAAAADPGADLRTELRPYQRDGVRWLLSLARLGLGGCLADDMGLGKTIQVLALLLLLKRGRTPRGPHLLVAPASLLANWKAEAERFAPSLRVLVAHPSALPRDDLAALGPHQLEEWDLVVASYGWVHRFGWLARTSFGVAVLDEAQAVKNPAARQTRAVKAIHARVRLALTGTPVENRASDLWSIFDYLNPGLLGSAKAFGAFMRKAKAATAVPDAPPAVDGHARPPPYAALRALIRPYLLRRLKTDPAVAADLPPRTEVKAWCALTRAQVALYAESVEALRRELAEVAAPEERMRRRGLVLAYLLRLKQICNHPSQWTGDGAYAPQASGKWARLAEIAEVVASRQEKALVFTQFRELTGPLARWLAQAFGRPGLVLHGTTRVKDRAGLVRRFQEDDAVPFMVLSLKAGGTGLNLTAASHVIHFDRWWNPAVEAQATDRAHRIGQRKAVLVHALVCRGTIEERIDAMLAEKRGLARELLDGSGGLDLTELDDRELLRVVSLDLRAASLTG